MKRDPTLLTHPIPSPIPSLRHDAAGATLPADQSFVPIPDDALAELDRVVAEQRAAPVPTLLLLPEHVPLDACRRLTTPSVSSSLSATRLRARLDDGLGLVVLGRFTVERLSAQAVVDHYWILTSFLEPPVAEERKDTVIWFARVAPS
jgi:hypothetical protein